MQKYENPSNYFTQDVIDFIKKNIENSDNNEVLFGCSIIKDEINHINNNIYHDSSSNIIDLEEIDKVIYSENEKNKIKKNKKEKIEREKIEENNGIDTDKKILNKVELLFRGNINSVIVDEEIIQQFDMIIHNHPSGNLSPSNADQIFANFCRENGVGFGIVNNNVSEIYVVVPFIVVNKVKTISEKEVTNILCKKNTKIKTFLPNFKERIGQIIMAKEIANSINKKENILIEAGTGIGKSLAYLIPSILYAKKNNIKVVISTNTIALQEQLFYKDLPLIENIIDNKVIYKILMGRGNYLCKLKYEIFKKSINDTLFESNLKEEFEQIKKYLEESNTGLLTELSFKISGDLIKEINASSETCIKNKCKYYSSCFYYKSRKEVTESDIIIVNHALYFASALNTESNVLPKHKILIFDEAHNIEDIIDKSLVKSLNLNLFFKSLNKFYNIKEKKGYLKLLVKYFEIKDNLENEKNLVDKISDNISSLKHNFNNIELLLREIVEQISDKSKFNNTELLFSEFVKYFHPEHKEKFNLNLKNIINDIINFENILTKLSNKIKEIKDDNLSSTQIFLKYYLNNFLLKFEDYKLVLNKFLITSNISNEIWIEIKPKNVNFAFFDSSLKSDFLSSIIERVDSTVFTSATLTTNKSFLFFKDQLFINHIKFKELILDSPYNYKEHSKIYIPKNIVEPNSKDFIDSIKHMILNLILLNKGNAFVLTTSYYDMKKLFNFLKDYLNENGINLFMQGYLYSKKKLIELFKSNENSVLLGTSTFWEGIDIPGQSLSLLIITKLPFKVPSNPMVQIKSQYIEKLNKNKFMDFMLPNAALKLKQGYGRLIRKEDDKGACFIFDKRIKTKQYGKIIINSLPDVGIMFDNYEKLENDYKNRFIF